MAVIPRPSDRPASLIAAIAALVLGLLGFGPIRRVRRRGARAITHDVHRPQADLDSGFFRPSEVISC